MGRAGLQKEVTSDSHGSGHWCGRGGGPVQHRGLRRVDPVRRKVRPVAGFDGPEKGEHDMARIAQSICVTKGGGA